jgi:putative transposase
MSCTSSPVTGKAYGLATVCRVWRLARSGVYRYLAPAPITPPQRRGPTGAMTDAALTAAIRDVLAASPFHGEGHRKVWARLRHAGTRTSLRRVLRLMRENDLLAPTRVGCARGPRAHDGTIIPATVNTMWVGRPARVILHGKKREHGRNSYDFGLKAGTPFRIWYEMPVCCVQS